MAAKRISLTVYRIRGSIDDTKVTEPEDVIQTDEQLIAKNLSGGHDFDAKLFLLVPPSERPAWADFLEQGFGTLAEVVASVTNNAVLVVKNGKDLFAIPFGMGRHLLKPGSYVWNYGLRVALNVVYPKSPDDADTGRIRSIDAKTVAANTLYTRRQANRWADFETFDVDIQRDLLNAVTGRPADTETWGPRVSGSDAIHLTVPLEFADLGKLCSRIEKASRQRNYQERFAWIDNIRAVEDQGLIAGLRDAIAGQFRQGDVAALDLAPPELVEWDAIKAFRFSVEPEVEHPDLQLADYLATLQRQGRLRGLTFQHLHKSHRIEVLDNDGNVMLDWPVSKCLTGEVGHGGTTYLVDGTDFFEPAPNYMQALDKFLAGIPESNVSLPTSGEAESEGDYNEKATKSSDKYLLLDKKTVRISTHTTPIEVCDILTSDRAFIHVKRKLGSSTLSHLFAQGLVSADLFVTSQEYRQKALDRIQGEEEKSTARRSVRGKFSSFAVAGIKAGDYEVVYAIIAKWDGKSMPKALPFFSKVNLRRQAQDLRRMGYRVSTKRIAIA